MAKAGALYEQDFFLWTKEQAAALRAEKLLEHSRLPLAWHDQRTGVSTGSRSSRAAALHGAHLICRFPFSGQSERVSSTSSRYTHTSIFFGVGVPFFARNMPMEFGEIRPMTPASS